MSSHRLHAGMLYELFRRQRPDYRIRMEQITRQAVASGQQDSDPSIGAQRADAVDNAIITEMHREIVSVYWHNVFDA